MRNRRIKGKWSAKKYWKQYLKQNDYEIVRNGQSTINHTLANALRLSSESQSQNDEFADFLTRGREDAIRDLRNAGIDIFVTGERCIEVISKNPKYRDEHNRRLARQLGQKIVATEGKAVVTPEERKELLLPSPVQVSRVKKRLLLPDTLPD